MKFDLATYTENLAHFIIAACKRGGLRAELIADLLEELAEKEREVNRELVSAPSFDDPTVSRLARASTAARSARRVSHNYFLRSAN